MELFCQFVGEFRLPTESASTNHFQPEGEVRERVFAWLGFDPRQQEQPTQQMTPRNPTLSICDWDRMAA